MSKTPVKNNESQNWNFSPKEVTSPTKDNLGLSRTLFIHICKIHKLVGDWLKIRDKGTQLCSCISALKLYECEDDYFPQQLKPLTESLMEALDTLDNIVNGVRTISIQMQALAKLQPSSERVIITWSASNISKQVENILLSMEKEYQLKKVVTENIAHCRDKNLIEVYASSWEFELYLELTIDDSSYLFAELGLNGLT